MPAGFTEDDYEPVEVWPEHWPAWQLFAEMSGQWRLSANGTPIDLDYTPVLLRLQLMGLPSTEACELFDDVRVIAQAAVQTIRAQQ